MPNTSGVDSPKLDPSAEAFTSVETVEDGLSDADGVEQRNEVCASVLGNSLALFFHGQP